MNDWITVTANRIGNAHPRGDEVLTLASGISPSGPIHMGNLREVFTTHFVADELKRRGRNVRHILSWDDYDRYRKVPAGVPGVDESWEQYIGRPLTAVPAPHGSNSPNWAEHFKKEFQEALSELMVEVEEISQTTMYKSGVYHDEIVKALNMRVKIGEILATHQTKGEMLDPNYYYPFKPYCSACGRDTTTVTSWNPEDETITYHCSCDESLRETLSEISGKLVWKVDWPMRWAFENVVFEPGGVDHMSPGSSWEVGEEIAPLFGFERPMGLRYSFVGFDGKAKMASSAGGAPIPNNILKVFPPEMIRWLYCRQRPEQAFTIDMVNNTSRLYDEWDSLTRKSLGGKLKGGEEKTYERSLTTFENASLKDFGNIIVDDVKFSAWTSYADITLCNREAMIDLAKTSGAEYLDLKRMEYAINWVNIYMPNGDRTIVTETFRSDYFNSISHEAQSSIHLLADGLADYYDSISDLTRWSFGAAKAHLGIDIDERNLTPEAKEFQKDYFRNVYQLLIGRDSGPRLPLLIHLIGVSETRRLLTGESF